MYQLEFTCPEGHITKDINTFSPSARSCGVCGANTMAPRTKEVVIGECEACRDPEELDWEAPDEPHHGEETECGECNATYYQDFGGEIYTTNEEAKKNFPQLKTL